TDPQVARTTPSTTREAAFHSANQCLTFRSHILCWPICWDLKFAGILRIGGRRRLQHPDNLLLDGECAEVIAQRIVVADEVAPNVRIDARSEPGIVGCVSLQKIDIGQPAPVHKINKRLIEAAALLESTTDGLGIVGEDVQDLAFLLGGKLLDL